MLGNRTVKKIFKISTRYYVRFWIGWNTSEGCRRMELKLLFPRNVRLLSPLCIRTDLIQWHHSIGKWKGWQYVMQAGEQAAGREPRSRLQKKFKTDVIQLTNCLVLKSALPWLPLYNPIKVSQMQPKIFLNGWPVTTGQEDDHNHRRPRARCLSRVKIKHLTDPSTLTSVDISSTNSKITADRLMLSAFFIMGLWT